MEWRDIPGFGGRYQVSDTGQVRNTRTGKTLSPWLNKGYREINLGRGNRVSVHTITLIAFTGGRPDGCEVNHKNGVRDDNCISNLEWVTRSQNIAHAHRELRRQRHAWARPVVVSHGGGPVIYPSTGKAAEALGSRAANVSKAISRGWKVKGCEVNYA